MSKKKPDLSLKQACLDEALRIIEADGLDKLSLREVSRRLGVSHQAPYKHFASREHILAEIIAMVFDEFSQHMEAHSRAKDVPDEMRALGLAYIDYALANPVKYRLMFSASLPEAKNHPNMLDRAHRCFALLHESLRKLDYVKKPGMDDMAIERDAMVIWTMIHGLVTALTSDAMDNMPMSRETRESAIAHTLLRIGTILSGELPGTDDFEKIAATVGSDFPNLNDWIGHPD